MSRYPRPRPVISLLLLTVVATLSLLLAACGKSPSSTPDVIVIVPSATANEPAPVLAADNRIMLEQAGATSTQADAYIVNPATGQPTEVRLTPRRPDGQVEYGPRRGYLLDQNVSRVEQLLQGQAASGPFDLLAMIAAAVRVASPPATLIVLSSGLSTAGGFDLRQVGWDADPRSVAAQLQHRGLLPDLAGWHVIFSGLDDTAGRQPPLPLPQRTTLASYWMAICRAAGAAACQTDETIRPDPPSLSTTPVPVIPVPQVVSVRGPDGSHGVSVPSDELFAFNSAALLPGADGVLRPLVAKALSGHFLITITGYASPDGGSAAYNLALSRARAQAVRARMVALGRPAEQVTKVTGLGTDGKTLPSCDVAGQFDEAVCAQQRRVIVLLIPPARGRSLTA
jgi:outer membrane protein OmpA-like peptidoglycan-associated protein